VLDSPDQLSNLIGPFVAAQKPKRDYCNKMGGSKLLVDWQKMGNEGKEEVLA